MQSLCRLCAKCMEMSETTTEISELKSKLTFCCGWKPSEDEIKMPQNACNRCVERLQRSWDFAESVWAAEGQLMKLAGESVESVEVWSSELVLPDEPIKREQIEPQAVPKEQSLDELDESYYPFDNVDTVFDHSDNDNADNKSVHSSKSRSESGSPTKLEGSKKQPPKDPFLSVLTPDDYLEGGLISKDGVAKLEKSHSKTMSTTWNDCQYKCDKCDKLFKGPHTFYAHIRSIHMEELLSIKVSCFYCNSKHRREFGLNRHIANEHFPHLKYRCAHCDDYYWDSRELNRHRNMHTNVEYKCELCGQICANKDMLYVHITMIHFKKKKIESERFTCDICGKHFTTKGGIRNHMVLHTEKFDYICDQCGWKFQSKGNLKGHLASTHVDVKLFKCEVCNKSFKTKPQMKNHMKHHDDVRPHECTECGRKFRRPYTLNVHMRSHTQVCPYTCRYCGKSFRHNITLQTHERAHTNLKPYACTICEYRSTSKGNLNKHMMRVHSIDFRNHVYQREN